MASFHKIDFMVDMVELIDKDGNFIEVVFLKRLLLPEGSCETVSG